MDSDFLPAIWPEDRAPEEVVNCRRCELCSQRTRVIWGEGNPHAPIIVILDNPGAREDRDGNEFICGTRQTLQSAAFHAKIKMEDMYITYILKCRPKRKYNKEEARGICMEYLLAQIAIQQPKFAFCMGNTSVQWFTGDMEASVKALRGTWQNIRGIPTLVTYHPLAVRRRPNLANQFMQDWMLLAHRFFREMDS